MVFAALNVGLPFSSVFSHSSCDTMAFTINSYQCSSFFLPPSLKCWHLFKSPTCLAATSRNTSSEPDCSPRQNLNSKPERSSPRIQKSKGTENKEKDPCGVLPITKPKKARRGRKSEAAAVEDFLRHKLEETLTSIKEQSPEIFEDRKSFLKERVDDDTGSDNSSDGADHDNGSVVNNMVVEQEDPNWPLDADVGWGTRASEFFEKYPIKNVVGEDGLEIDWEGEIDNGLVKEINCLEWESFAFHPSPLVVLVFERYNR